VVERSYETLEIILKAPIAKIFINRPKVRNAFNEVLIEELTDVCTSLAVNEPFRVVTLSGKGEVFSAGADLNWMRKVSGYGHEQNLQDALKFARMMEALYTLPQATIAAVNGPCIGGGIGLLSACDVALASGEAFFALAEIRLGIAPAVISPYVIRKIEERGAREFFLTGKRFDAATAKAIGLVNDVAEPAKFDEAVSKWEKDFLHSAPGAVKSCKELIARVSRAPIEDVREYTAELISRLRGAPEGREGFQAFFEKRSPDWDID
jgi:methylglutaconyl-CoA hydratase